MAFLEARVIGAPVIISQAFARRRELVRFLNR
jgi:hypothetical protein